MSVLATWILGAVVVPLNPMLRLHEMVHIAADAELRLLIAGPDAAPLLGDVRAATGFPQRMLWSGADDFAGAPLPHRLDTGPAAEGPDSLVFTVTSGRWLWSGDSIVMPGPEETALLTYTSGTTGPSKGAMNPHDALAYQAAAGLAWFGLHDTDAVLTVAPLFHITGLGIHLGLALGNGLPLILTYRFDPQTVAGLVRAYQPTFTVGAITAFVGLLNDEGVHPTDLESLQTVFSGGAPVSAGIVERYERKFGTYIHNIYGLTESTSACIGTPLGRRAPVDPGSGALSIGIAYPQTKVSIVDDDGRQLPPGEMGEIVIAGPQVITSYWRRRRSPPTPCGPMACIPATSASSRMAGCISSTAARI